MVRAAEPPDRAGCRCGGCGYNLVGLTGWTCPECGEPFSASEVAGQIAQRRYCRHTVDHLHIILGLALIAGLFVSVCGRLTVDRSFWRVESVVLFGSFVVGMAAGLVSTGRHVPRIHVWLWVRTVLWLHLPVVLAGPFRGAASLIGGLPFMPADLAALGCYLGWVILWIASAAFWTARYATEAIDAGVPESSSFPTPTSLAGILVCVASLGMGIAICVASR